MTPNQIKQEAANFNHTDAGFEADLVAFAKLILGKATGRYQARIQRNGKVISLGCFNTLEEASTVRAAAELAKQEVKV